MGNACDPATEEVIAAVQEGGKADVDKAVEMVGAPLLEPPAATC